jgi:hypothetical protein
MFNAANLPGRGRRGHSVVEIDNEEIAVLFGSDSISYASSAWLLSPAFDVWGTVDIPTPVRSQQVAFVFDGSLFVHGGVENEPFVWRASCSDICSWTRTELRELGCLRGHAACVLPDGIAVISGGSVLPGAEVLSEWLTCVNLSSMTVTKTTAAFLARTAHSSNTVARSKLLVFGGRRGQNVVGDCNYIFSFLFFYLFQSCSF